MDDKTQEERLEQELRFLKESFEAEVISKEEYEKGKDRIENKLKIQSLIKEQSIGQKEQVIEKQELMEEKAEESKAREAENIKLDVTQDKAKGQEQIQKTEQKELPKTAIPEEPKKELGEEKKGKDFLKYSAVFIVLVLVVFFSYSFFKNKPQSEETKEVKFIAACISDNDCKQESKEGSCINPGAKDAKCEFKGVPKINVLVLNDRNNCFNCDPQRVLNILDNWFEEMKVKEIDYNTDEGKTIAEQSNVALLPSYILDENITKKPAFEQFKQIFVKKDNEYILSEDAAGSTFYLKRDSVPNKLDLFVISGDNASIKAERNLKEFLEAFKEVKFEMHLSNDKLVEELGIKTFPTFLLNNKVKFIGVHSAETIKENFCKMNKLEACSRGLSKSLV